MSTTCSPEPLENWLPPTTPTLARRRQSTIADMIVSIEAGHSATVLQCYSATVLQCYSATAISSHTPPPLSVCTCAGTAWFSFTAASFLFVGRSSSAHSGSSSPGRTGRVSWSRHSNPCLPCQPGEHEIEGLQGNFSQSCVAFCVLSWNTNRYLLSRLLQQYFTQKKQTF